MAIRRVPLAVALLMVGGFVAGLAAASLAGPLTLPSWLTGTTTLPGAALPPSQPTRIAIPDLAVEARIHPVRLDADGSIAAPPMRRAHEVGWYRDGPSPGQFGPAILVGHVDTRTGPAVFHGLADLRPGSRVEVTRRDGEVVVFEVTEVRAYDKARLPAEEVYNDFSRPGLRLITCGGEWVGGDTGYADNVIAFASLIEPS